MANIKTKKNTKEVVAKEKDEKKSHPLILGPRITEKSALSSEKGAYVFNVKEEATKNEIKKAIKEVYGVTPERISVTQISDKKVTRRGKIGVKRGGKKAVVFLKKGDKITLA